jgi:hypothetical protein
MSCPFRLHLEAPELLEVPAAQGMGGELPDMIPLVRVRLMRVHLNNPTKTSPKSDHVIESHKKTVAKAINCTESCMCGLYVPVYESPFHEQRSVRMGSGLEILIFGYLSI